MKSLLFLPLLFLAHFTLYAQMRQASGPYPVRHNAPHVEHVQSNAKYPVVYLAPVTGAIETAYIEPMYIEDRIVVETPSAPVVYLMPVALVRVQSAPVVVEQNVQYRYPVEEQRTPQIVGTIMYPVSGAPAVQEGVRYVVVSPAVNNVSPVHVNQRR